MFSWVPKGDFSFVQQPPEAAAHFAVRRIGLSKGMVMRRSDPRTAGTRPVVPEL